MIPDPGVILVVPAFAVVVAGAAVCVLVILASAWVRAWRRRSRREARRTMR